MKRLALPALVLTLFALVTGARPAAAFCGFYVAKADTKIFNQASQVVLVRNDDRTVLTGIAWAMVVVVLFVPGALPWYYTWPLAVVAPLAQSRRAVAAIAGFSTWIMVIFKPDGAHGMYSWIHVLIATACAVIAWYTLSRTPETTPETEPAVATD